MVSPSEDLIDRLQAAAEDARAAAREAREARKDLRQATHEAREVITQVKSLVKKYIEDSLQEEIEKVWNEIMEEIKIKEFGLGLKKSFDQWVDLLEDANNVLRSLNEKDKELAAAFQRRDAGMVDWRRPVVGD